MNRKLGIFMSLLVLIIGYTGTEKATAMVVVPQYGAEVAGSLDCVGTSCGTTFTLGGPGTSDITASNGPSLNGSSESSTANLGTGILQAYATANGITGSSASAGALFWDTLTFTNQIGANVTLGSGQITLTLPGSNSLTFGAGGGTCLMQDFFSGHPLCTPFPSTYNPPVLNSSSTFPYTETISLAGLQTNTPYEFSAAIYGEVTAFNNGTANLGDPPTVSISNIPNGISIFSAAPGAFGLGNPPTSVPEPPTFWLMVTGIMGMFGVVGLRQIKARKPEVSRLADHLANGGAAS